MRNEKERERNTRTEVDTGGSLSDYQNENWYGCYALYKTKMQSAMNFLTGWYVSQLTNAISDELIHRNEQQGENYTGEGSDAQMKVE